MKAVRFSEGQIQTQDTELREPESGDWETIQVASAGICGSDLKMLELGIFGQGLPSATNTGVFCQMEPLPP